MDATRMDPAPDDQAGEFNKTTNGRSIAPLGIKSSDDITPPTPVLDILIGIASRLKLIGLTLWLEEVRASRRWKRRLR